MNKKNFHQILSVETIDDTKNETYIYTVGRKNHLPLALYLWLSFYQELPVDRFFMLFAPEYSTRKVKHQLKITSSNVQILSEKIHACLSPDEIFKRNLLKEDFIQLSLMKTSFYQSGMTSALPQVPNRIWIDTKEAVGVYQIHEQIIQKLIYTVSSIQTLLSPKLDLLEDFTLNYQGFEPITLENYYGF